VVPEGLLNLLCPTSYMQPTSPVTCHVAAHVYIYDLCVCLRDTVAFLLAGFVLCADRPLTLECIQSVSPLKPTSYQSWRMICVCAYVYVYVCVGVCVCVCACVRVVSAKPLHRIWNPRKPGGLAHRVCCMLCVVCVFVMCLCALVFMCACLLP
jgi:hypothetical protein